MKREEEKKEGMGCLGRHFKPTNENPKGTLYFKSHVVEVLIAICLLYLACVDGISRELWTISIDTSLIRVIGTWSLREDIFNKPQQICCWVRNFFLILCFTI
jgi:hypothetical protein